jgi:hypothetical protein
MKVIRYGRTYMLLFFFPLLLPLFLNGLSFLGLLSRYLLPKYKAIMFQSTLYSLFNEAPYPCSLDWSEIMSCKYRFWYASLRQVYTISLSIPDRLRCDPYILRQKAMSHLTPVFLAASLMAL